MHLRVIAPESSVIAISVGLHFITSLHCQIKLDVLRRCICICVCVCIYIYTHIHIQMCVCVYIYIYVCVFLYNFDILIFVSRCLWAVSLLSSIDIVNYIDLRGNDSNCFTK